MHVTSDYPKSSSNIFLNRHHQLKGSKHETRLCMLSLLLTEVSKPSTERMPTPYARGAIGKQRASRTGHRHLAGRVARRMVR